MSNSNSLLYLGLRKKSFSELPSVNGRPGHICLTYHLSGNIGLEGAPVHVKIYI